MSTGPLFNLIANDGKADRMILATELIQKRICDIRCYKAKRKYQSIEPTLSELEKTHILFMSAHYKPFIATAFEYTREPLQNGQGQWGDSENKFSIPQNGDFFHDMILYMKTNQLRGAVGTVPNYSENDFPTDITVDDTEGTEVTLEPSTIEDEDGNPKVKEYTIQTGTPAGFEAKNPIIRISKQYVNASGDPVSVGEELQGFVRWVEFPGIKAFKKLQFEVNGNILDEYRQDAMLFHFLYNVPVNKEVGYKKLVGQDIGKVGLTQNAVSADHGPFGAEAASVEDQLDNPLSEGFGNSGISAMSTQNYFTGNQTPAPVKPGLEIWTPLLFWFNKLLSLSVPSVSIPYGQRYIKVEMEEFNRVAQPAPGALKVVTTYERFLTANGDPADNVTEYIVNRSIDDKSLTFNNNDNGDAAPGVLGTSGQVKLFQLFINNLYIIPEVHDIFIQRIGFNLIRVHKLQVTGITNPNSSGVGTGIELNGLKYPIETMYFGFQPKENTNPNPSVNADYWKSWHSYAQLTKNSAVSVATVPGIAGQTIENKSLATIQTSKHSIWSEVPVVKKIGLKSHNIDVFRLTEEKFWNAYQPYKYGTYTIKTPKTIGTYMMTFALYPNEYQPSGHLNLSRAKDSYVEYESEVIDANFSVELRLVAIAINFLVIADGSAILRYNT